MEIFTGYGMLLVVAMGIIPVCIYAFYYAVIIKTRKRKQRLATKVIKKLSKIEEEWKDVVKKEQQNLGEKQGESIDEKRQPSISKEEWWDIVEMDLQKVLEKEKAILKLVEEKQKFLRRNPTATEIELALHDLLKKYYFLRHSEQLKNILHPRLEISERLIDRPSLQLYLQEQFERASPREIEMFISFLHGLAVAKRQAEREG